MRLTTALLSLFAAACGDVNAEEGDGEKMALFDQKNSADISFDTATGLATIKVPGWYHVSGRTGIQDLGDAKRCQLEVQKNGATLQYGTDQLNYAGGAGNTALVGLAVATVAEFAANDTVKIAVWHNHGAARNLTRGRTLTNFAMVRIE